MALSPDSPRLSVSSASRAPVLAAQPREHAAVLVVRMRGGVHHARGGVQLQQLLPGPGRTGVLRQPFGRIGYRGGDREQRQDGADTANCHDAVFESALVTVRQIDYRYAL